MKILLPSALLSLVTRSALGRCSSAGNCADCLAATPASPLVTSCTWFQDISFCAECCCGMDGCGASACYEDITTCSECIGQDQNGQYAWSPDANQCLPSCDVIADAACFPGSNYTAEEVCADSPVSPPSPSNSSSTGGCGAVTNCGDCLAATPSSPSVTSCTWFEDGELSYCEEGCGMDGCGASACYEGITTCSECIGQIQHGQYAWSPDFNECLPSCDVIADAACFPGSENKAEEVCPGYLACPACMEEGYAWSPTVGMCLATCDGAPVDGSCFPSSSYGPEICTCNALTSCTECVGTGSCAWSADACLESCDDAPADAPCFMPSNYFEAEDVCPSSPATGGCGAATNCADCLAATPSSPSVTSCTWFEEIGYCEEGCGMNGCGASSCLADIKNCHECIGQIQHEQYSWSPDAGCVKSCDDENVPADGSCFDGSMYGTEVCPCDDATSCSECVDSKNEQCAWSVDSCIIGCDNAPADAPCFPSAKYESEAVCDQPASPIDDESTSSAGDISTFVAILTVLMGSVVSIA